MELTPDPEEVRLHAAFSFEGLAAWNAPTQAAKDILRDSSTLDSEIRQGKRPVGVPPLYGIVPVGMGQQKSPENTRKDMQRPASGKRR